VVELWFDRQTSIITPPRDISKPSGAPNRKKHASVRLKGAQRLSKVVAQFRIGDSRGRSVYPLFKSRYCEFSLKCEPVSSEAKRCRRNEKLFACQPLRFSQSSLRDSLSWRKPLAIHRKVTKNSTVLFMVGGCRSFRIYPIVPGVA
jgi:hypothetical protein